jgi:hypothetical protein
MSLLGNAVLVNWGGVVASKENEYNQWHSIEHMPERISLTGFLRGCRAVGITGTDINHKYFMMYEAERKEVFTSKKYLERLNNPTKWTKDILSHYLSPSRTICSVITSKSIGFGGYFSTIRFSGKLLENKHNVKTLKLSVPQTIKIPGITGMHILLGNNTFGQMNTEEKSFRASQGMVDKIISQAIIIEGLNFKSLSNAIASLKEEYSLIENKNLLIDYYCCQHVLTKQDLEGV